MSRALDDPDPDRDPDRDSDRDDSVTPSRLRCGVVLAVSEETCEVLGQGQRRSARFATPFPSPRTERVSPGHLVALASAPDGADVVVFRWFDAVVVGEESGLVRLWEPAHGDVLARSRRADQRVRLGTRAYLSAGLPGADWWVAGPVVERGEGADVELDAVETFCTDYGVWDTLG